MSLSDKYTLKPSLSETFKGIIWKVETDDKNTVLAIETRSVSDRTTHFSAFNYATGQCLFKEITVEDGWFWSIGRVHDGLLFLHSYVNESNPEHKGIIAIDPSGEIAWQQFHKTLQEVCNEGLLVYNPKIQPKMLELISAGTGEPASTNVKQAAPVEKNIIVPDILSDYSNLKDLLPEDIAGPVFHTQFNKKDILVFHTRNNDLFNQQLIVYQNQVIVLEDFLARDIQKLNPEAFFIERSHLFYIRDNKQEFVSYLV
jgi:hypothetical protein